MFFPVPFGNKQTSKHTFFRHERMPRGEECRRNPNAGRYSGKRFSRTSSRRISTMAVRFMPRASMVARPVSVRPRTFQVAVNAKWSDQSSVRGLNSDAVCPVFGSTADVRADLRSEQATQARARFVSSVGPPCDRGETWSTWNVASCDAWGRRQYSQASPARWRTWRISRTGIWGLIAYFGPHVRPGASSAKTNQPVLSKPELPLVRLC